MTLSRETYSGDTTFGSSSGAAGDGVSAFGAACGDWSQATVASASSTGTSQPLVMLRLQGAAHGGFQLIDGRPVIAEGAEVLERRLAIRALGIQEVQQADAAATVGELHSLPRLLGFGQVGVTQQHDALALDLQRGVRGVDVGQGLARDRVAQRRRPADLRLRAGDLALVAVEHAQRNADADTER